MTVHLVVGPPCSGKTHHVREHARPGDLVIDWDDIAIELGSHRTHLHDRALLPRIAAEYDRRLELVADHPADVWIIRGLPDPVERSEWAARFNAEVVVCMAPRDLLVHRAQARGKPSFTVWSIDRWLRRAGVDQGAA